MAVYLVDLENVRDAGLEGVTQLTENDLLVIGYSQAKHQIAGFYMDAIEHSGCRCKLLKLKRTGKNGLDFYIASEAGIQFGNGEKEIGIISKDTGFQAVLDYFNTTYGKNIHITKGESVLNCWNYFHPNKIKRNITDLDTYSLILQNRDDRIRKVLVNTRYKAKSGDIVNFVKTKRLKDKFSLYNDITHRFGKREGTEIYNIIKNVINKGDN